MDELLMDELLTIPQAAKRFNIARRTLHRWVTTGKVPSVTIAGMSLINPSAIIDLAKPMPRGKYPRVKKEQG